MANIEPNSKGTKFIIYCGRCRYKRKRKDYGRAVKLAVLHNTSKKHLEKKV